MSLEKLLQNNPCLDVTLTPELQAILDENDYELCRMTPHGVVGVRRYIYTYGIGIGLDEIGLSGRYCYDTALDCIMSLRDWEEKGYEGEPEDYIVRKGFGVEDKQG